MQDKSKSKSYRRQLRRKLGVCIRCGEPEMAITSKGIPSTTYCAKHLKSVVAVNKARRSRLRGKGLCISCGPTTGKKAAKYRRRCKECLAERYAKHKAARLARTAKGLCVHCPNPAGRFISCVKCRKRQLDCYYRKKEKRAADA